MNSQATTQLIQTLTYVLIPIIIAIFALVGFLVYLYFKENKNKKEKQDESVPTSSKTPQQNKQSIFNFMEFDTVRDNMIIQRKGKRYLMVIECQGINYDLMSNVEKTGVEEGFVQFLNTLRYQIQIYVQTRSVNLENSLQGYRARVKDVESKLRKMQVQYEEMKDSGKYTDEQLQKAYYEVTKQSNLYEYGKSILQDTERMSLNKNILNKKYYIIVPYYSAEAGNENLDTREIEEIAFSELYTRAQSLIRSISTCGVRGKILKSNELIELLYMAYNREDAETFGVDKAIKAGFNEMYSTAPDVLKKRMKEIDNEIEEKAIQIARDKVNEAKSEIEQELEDKENHIDELIGQMARMIIAENEEYIGNDVVNRAIEKVTEELTQKSNTKEGGNENGKKKTTRGRKKSTTN